MLDSWFVFHFGFRLYGGVSECEGETVSLNQNFATPEFFTLFNLKLVEGKLPVEEDGFVVNRAALRALGYTSLEELPCWISV